MPKKLEFFKFFPYPWLKGKISDCEPQEVGIYARLLALVWENGGRYKLTDISYRGFNTSEQVFNTCLSLLKSVEIIYEDEDGIGVKFLDEQLAAYEALCIQKSKAGKISAQKRTGTQQRFNTCSTGVQHNPNTRSKDNKIYKENISKDISKKIGAVIEELNETAGTEFLATDPQTERLVAKAFLNGFTKADLSMVIQNQCFEWLKDPKFKKYLRPSTLFGEKLGEYVAAAKLAKKGKSTNGKRKYDL